MQLEIAKMQSCWRHEAVLTNVQTERRCKRQDTQLAASARVLWRHVYVLIFQCFRLDLLLKDQLYKTAIHDSSRIGSSCDPLHFNHCHCTVWTCLENNSELSTWITLFYWFGLFKLNRLYLTFKTSILPKGTESVWSLENSSRSNVSTEKWHENVWQSGWKIR